jgi:FkbM family methyltransferase
MPSETRTKTLDKNVIVFTTHKAGSMVLHRVLADICQKNDITYYSPNQNADKQLPFDRIFGGEDFIAARKGCFGPLRFFVPSAALSSANIIVHLRDPRDVLTSMFFSYCFIHPGEIEANTGYRKEVAEAGIDKFVLDMTDENFTCYKGDYGIGSEYSQYTGNVHNRYITYLKEVVGRSNAVVISYEEMVLDFASWLRKLLAAFELPDRKETYRFVVSRHAKTVKPAGENIWSHKRKVTPGDYKEKLQPETISKLNLRFSEVLDTLGYSSPQYEMNRRLSRSRQIRRWISSRKHRFSQLFRTPIAVIRRIKKVLRYSKSGQGIRGKMTCGLVGLGTPMSPNSGAPRSGKWVPDVLRIAPSRLRGLSLLINPHDWSQTVIYEEIFVATGYDLSVVKFEPEHVVDCGGHIGLFSLLASSAFPKAKITIFEPNPDNFFRIRENRRLNGLDWDCRLAAVGANAGETYLDVINSHSARLSARGGLPTKVFQLAAFITALGPSSLVLKIDVEGEERAMWPELIPRLPIQTVVFFETHHGSGGWSEAEKQFSHHGFKVQKLVDRGKFCDGYAERITR